MKTSTTFIKKNITTAINKVIKQLLFIGLLVLTSNWGSSQCTTTSTNVEPITLVNFSNINNTTAASTASPAYEDFTSIVGNVIQGNSYTITVKGNTDGGFTNYFTAFIDWNNNGTLNDAGEVTQIGSINSSTGIDVKTAFINITIPTSVVGNIRMRIRKNFSTALTDPCTINTYGQTEDYTLNVIPNICSGTPSAGTVSPSNLLLCPSESFTLTTSGASAISGGITYQWQSSPEGANIWTDIAGATSSSYSASAPTSHKDYRFKITCSNSSETTYSNVAEVKAATCDIYDYISPGVDQTFTVPDCVTKLEVHMWGAGGAGGDNTNGAITKGGGGGYVTGELNVTSGENLTVITGQGGTYGSSTSTYGGGGAGGGYNINTNGSSFTGSGGGRSAIRRGATELATAAGGGGGGETPSSGSKGGYGGAGGGTTGSGGANTVQAGPGTNAGGRGATSSAGGSGGTGGAGLAPTAGTQFLGGQGGTQNNGTNRKEGGGGGGGYYGGGGGAATNTQGGGGGGGSSYTGSLGTASTIGGTWQTAGNYTSIYNNGNYGKGGDQNGNGQNGRIVFKYAINPTPEATLTTANSTICIGNTVTLGGVVTTTGAWTMVVGTTPNTGTITVTGTGNTNWTQTVTPNVTTTYSINSITSASGCPATLTGSTTVTLPPAGSTLGANGDVASCIVNDNSLIQFYHSSGRLLAVINSNGQNLGNVSVTSYVDAGPSTVPACADPSNLNYATATMARHWVITPTIAPTSAVSVYLPFNDGEYNSLATLANGNVNANDNLTANTDLKLSKYSGTNENGVFSDNCGNGVTTLYPNGGIGSVSVVNPLITNASYAAYSISSFSEFWLHGSVSSPLPVKLTNFSATCDDVVTLNWTTASEQNSDRFVIEKSRDGQDWLVLATQAAAGNSNTIINYTQVDENKWNGVTYYRLKQIDFNGEEAIYGPISTSCEGNESSMTVFPNPNNGSFTIEIASDEMHNNASLLLTDMTGKVISTQKVNLVVGTTQILIDNLDLQKGTYLVTLRGADAQLKPVKVLVK